MAYVLGQRIRAYAGREGQVSPVHVHVGASEARYLPEITALQFQHTREPVPRITLDVDAGRQPVVYTFSWVAPHLAAIGVSRNLGRFPESSGDNRTGNAIQHEILLHASFFGKGLSSLCELLVAQDPFLSAWDRAKSPAQTRHLQRIQEELTPRPEHAYSALDELLERTPLGGLLQPETKPRLLGYLKAIVGSVMEGTGCQLEFRLEEFLAHPASLFDLPTAVFLLATYLIPASRASRFSFRSLGLRSVPTLPNGSIAVRCIASPPAGISRIAVPPNWRHVAYQNGRTTPDLVDSRTEDIVRLFIDHLIATLTQERKSRQSARGEFIRLLASYVERPHSSYRALATAVVPLESGDVEDLVARGRSSAAVGTIIEHLRRQKSFGLIDRLPSSISDLVNYCIDDPVSPSYAPWLLDGLSELNDSSYFLRLLDAGRRGKHRWREVIADWLARKRDSDTVLQIMARTGGLGLQARACDGIVHGFPSVRRLTVSTAEGRRWFHETWTEWEASQPEARRLLVEIACFGAGSSSSTSSESERTKLEAAIRGVLGATVRKAGRDVMLGLLNDAAACAGCARILQSCVPGRWATFLLRVAPADAAFWALALRTWRDLPDLSGALRSVLPTIAFWSVRFDPAPIRAIDAPLAEALIALRERRAPRTGTDRFEASGGALPLAPDEHQLWLTLIERPTESLPG